MAIDKLKEWFIRSSQKQSRERRLAPQDAERISKMFATLAAEEPLARPSQYWQELNKMNLAQMEEHGYENFKRTIALNYFTWVRILPWDSQVRFLSKHLPAKAVFRAFRGALAAPGQSSFSSFNFVHAFSYSLLSLLLWEYLLRLPLPQALLALREPEEGNPPVIYPRPGMRVSQDLGNSLLEYDALQVAIPAGGRGTVLELGGGYGRNAFVILSMHPDVRYVFVDIPPALWIAEKYLSAVFPEKRIFRFRPFDTFEEIAGEYAEAQLVFLLSSQFAKVPAHSADLALNISSLHEMRKEQIDHYLGQFDRVLKRGGHAYLKQWKTARVLFEGITVSEKDYHIPPAWTAVMNRTARVQTKFFEALYRKSSD
ncbi:MAG TPA: putative sugar O-methyltransferase [Candidatus Acidoferrales bacterium]|nr:putative sugar O-methyltransferase [Candidatus Acidoferrales bacterium]